MTKTKQQKCEEEKKEVKKKKKVAILVLNNHRYIPNYFFKSVLDLLTYNKKYVDIDICHICAHDIALMRNLAVQQAIDMNYDFAFMCDIDMEYPMDSIVRLYARWLAQAEEDSIFVGSARTRTEPHQSTQFYKVGIDGFKEENNRVYADPNSNEVIKIEGTGLVGALIPITALKKLNKPYFETIYRKDGSYDGEDINFARKCKEQGINIYLDPQVNYGHEIVKLIYADGEKLEGTS